MGLFNKNEGGLMDVIRCDEQDYLIWKWRPTGSGGSFTKKENAIRWGSSLRVREGSVAVFVYSQKDGTKQDFIEGAFDEIIKTKNLPILTSILGLAYDGNTPFQAEVYFINLAQIIQLKFGVPFFDVFDPRFTDFSVPVAVRGTLTFKITNYREFIKLHRLQEFDMDTFKGQIKDFIIKETKGIIVGLPADNNTSVLQLEKQISIVNELIEKKLKDELNRDFGIDVSRYDISDIEINRESEGYFKLKSVTQDVQAETIRTQHEANLKNIRETQRINQENLEATLKAQREEAQYAQHLQTESQNIGAFQTEKQAEVGVAGAEALGKMGAAGGTNVDLGGGNGGMNMAGMMAGMAMGGALGQNMAGIFNSMNHGLNNQNMQTPPPIPQNLFYVALSNEQTAQFDINSIRNLIQQGMINKDTLVWKQGMTNWAKASEVQEISNLFNLGGMTPPPLPKQ